MRLLHACCSMIEQYLIAEQARIITLEEEIKDAAKELATLRAKDSQYEAMINDARDSARGNSEAGFAPT